MFLKELEPPIGKRAVRMPLPYYEMLSLTAALYEIDVEDYLEACIAWKGTMDYLRQTKQEPKIVVETTRDNEHNCAARVFNFCNGSFTPPAIEMIRDMSDEAITLYVHTPSILSAKLYAQQQGQTPEQWLVSAMQDADTAVVMEMVGHCLAVSDKVDGHTSCLPFTPGLDEATA